MTIAVTGATGQFGRLAIAGLKALLPVSEIVALVRHPDKAADLGVELRLADYDRPETLAPALSGVDRLLFVSGSEVGPRRIAQHRNVVEAARRAGVRHIVYTSLLRAGGSPLSLAAEHRATEAAIRESGIPYTFLRNGWYAENYTAAIGATLAGGAVIGSAGSGRASLASRADYAEAAVAVLTGEGHEFRTYELAGDEAVTLADLAAEISRQSGREIAYRDLPEEVYAEALAGFGLPPDLARAVAAADAAVSRGELHEEGRALSSLIGRPTTPISSVVTEALR